MKPIIQTLLSGAMILALSPMFTSCEDILGHWEKPVADVYTPTTFKVWNGTGWVKIDISSYDFTKLTPANIASMVSEGKVILPAGKYLIDDNITIDYNVMVDATTSTFDLYIQDGASLTINGSLNAGDLPDGIKIAGQKDGTGKINITATTSDGITAKKMTIDGGQLLVNNSDATSVPLAVKQLEANSGSVSATNTGGAAMSVTDDVTITVGDADVSLTGTAAAVTIADASTLSIAPAYSAAKGVI